MALKEIEKLTKRLGEIDNEKRQILDKLRNNPDNIVLMTKHMLESIIKAQTWYEKKTEKGVVYGQIISADVEKNSLSMSGAKNKPIVSVSIKWNQCSESSPNIIPIASNISISAFNEIEPQILNGFKRTTLDEKKVKKTILELKEKSLLEQIRLIREEKKNIK